MFAEWCHSVKQPGWVTHWDLTIISVYGKEAPTRFSICSIQRSVWTNWSSDGPRFRGKITLWWLALPRRFTLQLKGQLNAHSLCFLLMALNNTCCEAAESVHVHVHALPSSWTWPLSRRRRCRANPCVDVLHKHLTAILQSSNKSCRDTLGVPNNLSFF